MSNKLNYKRVPIKGLDKVSLTAKSKGSCIIVIYSSSSAFRTFIFGSFSASPGAYFNVNELVIGTSVSLSSSGDTYTINFLKTFSNDGELQIIGDCDLIDIS